MATAATSSRRSEPPPQSATTADDILPVVHVEREPSSMPTDVVESPKEEGSVANHVSATPPPVPMQDADAQRAPSPTTQADAPPPAAATSKGAKKGAHLAPLSAPDSRLYISDAWVVPDSPLYRKGQGGEARRLAAMHERGGQDLEAAAVVPTPQAVRVPASFWRPTESDNVIREAPSMRIDAPPVGCFTACRNNSSQALTFLLVTFFSAIHMPLRCFYLAASMLAYLSQEATQCCDAPNPNVNSWDFYLRRLVTSEFYVLYLVFFILAYIFYGLSLIPLHILAVISATHADELRRRYFRITCCEIEDYGNYMNAAAMRGERPTGPPVPAVPMPAQGPGSVSIAQPTATQVLPHSAP